MAVVGGKAHLAIAEFAGFLPDQLGHIFASRYARGLQVTAVLHPFDNGLHVLLMLFRKARYSGEWPLRTSRAHSAEALSSMAMFSRILPTEEGHIALACRNPGNRQQVFCNRDGD